MKLISALIRPHRLDDVRMVVARMGLVGLTVTEVEEFGAETPRTEVYRGAEYRFDWQPRMRIEVAVEDELTDQVVEAICNVARTGRKGDGRVFVAELEDAIRIRTGEAGTAAL
jgi:nitrogen regulatory protein P-II 2